MAKGIIILAIKKIKQLFCKHDYAWCRKVRQYHRISGETHYLVCQKCGKIKREIDIEYP